MTDKVMDIDAVKRHLPHREPILMVSRVEGWVRDLEIHTSHTFTHTGDLWGDNHYGRVNPAKWALKKPPINHGTMPSVWG